MKSVIETFEIMKKYNLLTKLAFIFLVLSIYIFSKQTDEFKTAIKKFLTLIKENYLGSCIFIVLLILFMTLLQISHKKFIQDYKEYNRPKMKESSEKRPLTTRIYDEYQLKGTNEYLHREVTLINPYEVDIRNIKGKIILFDNGINVGEIPFEKDLIYAKKGQQFDFWIDSTDPSTTWNEFHTLIESMHIGTEQIENKILYGITFYRTYSFIFSRFNYIKIFGKRILPYEITWLKRQWAWEVWPKFIFLPSSWSSKHGWNKGLFWVRFRKRIYQLIILISTLSIFGFSIYSFGYVLSKTIYIFFVAYIDAISKILV